jgi:hypothetical protein
MNEIGKSKIADVEPEVVGRNIFKIVGFIEDDCAIVGQDRRDIGFSNRKVSKEQMVIDHDDIGLHRFLPHERQEAPIVVFAFGAQTSIPPCIQT